MAWSKTRTSIVGGFVMVGLGLAIWLALMGLKKARHQWAVDRVERRVAEIPQRFTNSLGMVFNRVTNTEVLFCIWKTRVQDFSAFAKASGRDMRGTVHSYGANGWQRVGDSWEHPGFEQTPTAPVCGVNWEEAVAFCDWLTQKERADGELNPHQSYRLPTDAEWSAAVTKLKFPWGSQWPPLEGTANLCGEENVADAQAAGFAVLKGYRDKFPRPAPVGSFPINPNGLFDMAGNAQEWCADWFRKEMNSEDFRKKHPVFNNDDGGETYRVLRGSHWLDRDPGRIASATRSFYPPQFRVITVGFRVVLADDSIRQAREKLK